MSKFTPYIEITKRKNIKGREVLEAIIWVGEDFWPGLTYTRSKSKANTFFNTEKGFLARVNRFGEILGLKVEKNY